MCQLVKRVQCYADDFGKCTPMVLTHTVAVKYCTYLVVAKHVTVADDHNAISCMQIIFY